MIHTFKDVMTRRPKMSPLDVCRYVEEMRNEIRETLKHWENVSTSEDAKKHYPEFSRGYMTALREILG